MQLIGGGIRRSIKQSQLYKKQQACLIGESLWQAGSYKRAAEMIMNHFAKV
ncbi:hypothetical protein [Paenibacillus sp. RU5M]|uniref:hypothetical protein n=1 Tax=Paenibacillus sp. RU5M TaxID=1907396 RepID=UPI0015CB945C|nr:hypothetical protein [Paenibacillus sp. RU5M]